MKSLLAMISATAFLAFVILGAHPIHAETKFEGVHLNNSFSLKLEKPLIWCDFAQVIPGQPKLPSQPLCFLFFQSGGGVYYMVALNRSDVFSGDPQSVRSVMTIPVREDERVYVNFSYNKVRMGLSLLFHKRVEGGIVVDSQFFDKVDDSVLMVPNARVTLRVSGDGKTMLGSRVSSAVAGSVCSVISKDERPLVSLGEMPGYKYSSWNSTQESVIPPNGTGTVDGHLVRCLDETKDGIRYTGLEILTSGDELSRR